MMQQPQPIIVVANTQNRETGRKAQLSNITAAKAVADVVRTCLGPCAMLKMLLDPMGGIVLTNDGNAILRECEVTHPAAKSIIDLARTQDDEVGDGTTSVIVLAGELLVSAVPFLEREVHPIIIVKAYKKAMEIALSTLEKISKPVEVNDETQMRSIVESTIGTKFLKRWSNMMCKLAVDAVRTVVNKVGDRIEVDTKRYLRIEKIPCGEVEECEVLDGIMINKDIVHPAMRRSIMKPRILLLDCSLEYKKGESQTNIELTREEDWSRVLEIEEEQIQIMCENIAKFKPDLVITEKGVSDVAQHYLLKNNISVIRRIRKTDNNRIAKAVGATIVNRVEDIKESDIGTKCGEFKIIKIGDEYYTYLVKCINPKACTVVLRGPNKDIVNEIERNLMDAISSARNVYFSPKLCPGGGASEMAMSVELNKVSKTIDGASQWIFKAVAEALEVIPRTLVKNCGGNPIKTLTYLRAKHANGEGSSYGINGLNGNVVDMLEEPKTNQNDDQVFYPIWEPLAVKVQTLKTAIEASCLLLRVDDIVSGRNKKKESQSQPQNNEMMENPMDGYE